MPPIPGELLMGMLGDPRLAAPLARVLLFAAEAEGEEEFLRPAVVDLAEPLGAELVAVVRGEKGAWRTLFAFGKSRTLPAELLAEALDNAQPRLNAGWGASPLHERGQQGELLVALRAKPANAWPQLAPAARALGQALELVRRRRHDAQRALRLQTIVEILAARKLDQPLEPLLVRLAEAATRLLGAERASIFLWDRQHKELVGRPALGVPGGELRIPDTTGVVGQVVHSGEPRRIDADIVSEQHAVDRSVDKQLKFHTRTLLTVPLRGARGDLFGAFQVLNKQAGNFTADDQAALEELARHAAGSLEDSQQFEALVQNRKQLVDDTAGSIRLIGECPAVEALRSAIRRVSGTELSVLILGENGTGKEVVAQMVHYGSPRRQEPFIAVNCAALAETLLESELFGHEKGAFTDARETRQGKFELASRGTLFLDEIGDMSLAGQAKLLRVLEERVVVRVGGSTPIPTAARVVAATNQDLGELVRQKRFREDLFFRLNVVTLEMPPLRTRGDDVLLLAEHFLQHFCLRARRKAPKFTAAAHKRLLAHSWPGNVREMRNLMERIAFLSPDDQDKLDAADLNFVLAPPSGPAPGTALDATLNDATTAFQAEYIQRQITAARGNMSLAAERLGLHRSNLYRKMRQLGLEAPQEE